METCPNCGGELTFDEVDIGVGTMRSPAYCNTCKWTQDSDVDALMKKNNTGKTGLITPGNLPSSILKALTHGQIQELGYWLFKQLVAQRDFTRKEIKPS